MNEIVFLGLSKAQWELINSFSNWISAIGTVAAVVVSLRLATRSMRVQCIASVGHRLVIQSGEQGAAPEIVLFRIVNTGEKPIRITGIGWRVGVFRWRREAMQMFDPLQSSPMPVELSHGQEAQWSVPLKVGERRWLHSFSKKLLSQRPRFYRATLRACFITSVGKTFYIRPERGFFAKLAEAANVPI